MLGRPYAYSNDGGWLPGQKRIDLSPQPDKPIEHEDLKAAKSAALEKAPVHKPRGPGRAIEMDHRFDMKACFRKFPSQFLFRIALMMSENLIERAIDAHTLGH